MTNAILNHYKLLKQRGLIHPGTTVHDFIDNLECNFMELHNAYADDVDKQPSDEFVTELINTLMTITDIAQHYNIDIPEQMAKINKRQEGMISRLTFTE